MAGQGLAGSAQFAHEGPLLGFCASLRNEPHIKDKESSLPAPDMAYRVGGGEGLWKQGRHMVRPDLLISARCSHRVKQSELFDRWKSLQICKWAMDTSEANLFKYALPSACLPTSWCGSPLAPLQIPIICNAWFSVGIRLELAPRALGM